MQSLGPLLQTATPRGQDPQIGNVSAHADSGFGLDLGLPDPALPDSTHDAARPVEGWMSTVDDHRPAKGEVLVDQLSTPVFWLDHPLTPQQRETGATKVAEDDPDAPTAAVPSVLPAAVAPASLAPGTVVPMPSVVQSGGAPLSGDVDQSGMASEASMLSLAIPAAVQLPEMVAPQQATTSGAGLAAPAARADLPAMFRTQEPPALQADSREVSNRAEREAPPRLSNPPNSAQQDPAATQRPDELIPDAATVAFALGEEPAAALTAGDAVLGAKDAEPAHKGGARSKDRLTGVAQPPEQAAATALSQPMEQTVGEPDLQAGQRGAPVSPPVSPPQRSGEARFALSLLGTPLTQLAAPVFAGAFGIETLSGAMEAMSALISGGGVQVGPSQSQHAVGPAGPASGPVAQLAAQVVVSASAGQSTTELTLSPKELGDVRLTIRPHDSDASRVVVMMTFERPEAMDLFRRNADLLVADLRAAGFSGAELGFAQSGSEQGRNPATDARPAQTGIFEGDMPVAVSALPARHGATSTSLDLRL